MADQLAVVQQDGPADPAPIAGGPPARRCYLVEVVFDRIDDEETRRFCNNVPTRLSLPDKTVDGLIGIGARLLRESKDLRELVSVMYDTVEAETPAAKAGGGGG